VECASCGHANPERAKFCLECGSPFSPRCNACGTELPPNARFCLECGAAQDGAPPKRTEKDRPLAYTPKHLADKILTQRSALEGERKQVTVLFADVKSSMELAEQLGAEAWHEVLERFFTLLSDGIHRFEGTVNQYTGDGIMALFGAPIAHEDHAQRACYAALHLRDGLRELAHDVKRRNGVDFATRIGLNSGEVIVGKIGDDLRMDYTAQGHTVGLAQRMEALAAGGSIYLSEHTAALASGWFALEDLGEFTVKGASDPLRVFELTGVGDVRTRFDLSQARGLTRFVGRHDELTLLETALEQALAGPGRTVGISAQAGTGKSRLCFEFLERCRARGLPVVEARGVAHGRQIPLLPMLELVRSFFGIQPEDSERVTREKVAGRVLLLDESLRDELPILFDLLGVPDPERPLPALDPEALQRRMHAAVRTIARADGHAEPGVVLIEDLHWLDPASDALIAQVIAGLSESPSLMLVNFRPEYRARWMQQSHYQQLSLMPLSPEALHELLRDLLGEHESVASLPAAIQTRTGGNPFFSEEVVRSLVEDGALEGTRGSYRLARPIESLPLPESVHSVLAARIDRLPEREKQVLQSASVIGKSFGEPLLSQVVELPARDLEEALRRLQDAEFLYETALYPEREYTFKHPLTQEVADGSQLRERRQRAHAATARAIEASERDRLDEKAALLAHHWEGAGEPLTAAGWHARAAKRIGVTDYQEAFAHWRRVDELLEGLADGPEVAALRHDALPRLLSLGFRVGIGEAEATALFERGRTAFERSGDYYALAMLLQTYAGLRQSGGHLVEYFDLMNEAADIARRNGDDALEALVSIDLLWASMLGLRIDDALAAGDQAIAFAGDDAEFGIDRLGWSVLILNLAFSAFALACQGRLAEAERRLERATQLASGRNAHETLGWVAGQQLELELARGNPERALAAGKRCVENAQRSGSGFDVVLSRCWLGVALAGVGDWRAAREILEEAEGLARQQRVAIDMVLSTRFAWVEACFRLGDVERARRLADEALAECEREGARLAELRLRLVCAQIDPGEASVHLRAAARLVDASGAHGFTPAVLEGRARRAATADERDRLLREALALYTEMGATGHVERLTRGLGA
jgi:class 3 adenylate cyclase/tetratricopeptide (TPR) repeat protein